MGEVRRTIGIIDNDRFTLSALNAFIRQCLPRFTILWSTDSGDSAITRCRTSRTCPDIILVDMSMGDTSGLTITRTIRERNSKTSIIAITSFPIHNYAAKAADAGAQAIASKGDPTDIALTINKVSTLGVWNSVDNTLFEPAAKAYGRVSNSMSSRKGTLTARENTIITLCSQGKTSIEIAEELNISPKTVNTHFQRISDKLGARNRVQLVAIWMEYRHQYHEGA